MNCSFLMLSLFRFNSWCIYRPRLGKKAAARRIEYITFCIVCFCLLALELSIGTDVAMQQVAEGATEAMHNVEQLATDQAPTSSDDDTAQLSEIVHTNGNTPNAFQVQLVSYQSIRQQELQQRITGYQHRQKQIQNRLKKLSVKAVTSDLDSSVYLSTVERKIEQAGTQHWLQSDKRLIGSAEVHLTIGYNGQLLQLNILTSSGDPLLDNELLASVRLSAPFPPVPLSLRQANESDSFALIRWLRFMAEARQ